MCIKEQLTPLVFKKESETLSLSGIARKYGVSKQYITQLHTEYKTQYPELFAETEISPDWLNAQLDSHTILEICNMTGKSYHTIKKLMGEYGLSKPTATAAFDEDYVREQYITLCRSDKELAAHYDCSVSLVKKFRYEHAILKTERQPLSERLTEPIAHQLIECDRMTLEQLSEKFDATPGEITRVLKRYGLKI